MMTRMVAASALVFLISALVMVNTSSASIVDFYVLPEVGGQVYLLSRTAVGDKDAARSKCGVNSAELALFESKQEYLNVISYLDVFLKSTNGTGVKNINGIWIELIGNPVLSVSWLWKMEISYDLVWAAGEPDSSCVNYVLLLLKCCGTIAVDKRLVTSGLNDENCGDSFWCLCKVKNECAFNETNKCTQLCKDEVNGYTCSCKPGYTLTSDNHTCVDIDECNGTTLSPKPCQQECRNTNGSYTCECHHGYQLNADLISCADINECNTNVHMCGDVCNNFNGSYNCSCRPGFELGNDSKSCVDVNECNTSYHMCDHACNNVNGSYLCTCNSGIELGKDSKSCFDINKCNTSDHMCDHACNNVNGSCLCTCNSGFELGNDSKCCFDINECNDSKPCHQICNNFNGSYNCSCDPGFELGSDSKSCFAVSEYNISNQCDHSCNNVNGSYNISCSTGFQLTSDGRSCIDIDECNTTSHLCNHTCNNTEGSYECTCKDGYKLSPDLVTCQEINEFNNVSVNCERNCTINGSSVTSVCDPGFVLDTNDNKTCHDVNECSTQPCHQTCHNTPGSFTCSCHLGFTLDDDLVTCRQNESNHQLCPCQCSDLTRYNSVPDMVQNELRRHLILSKTHLLSFRLSKGCADDNRFIARAIGCSGCLIAVVFVSIFLAPDLMTACRVILNYLKHRTPHEVRDRM